MTRDDVAAATREAIAACEQLAGHLGRLRARMAGLFPLTEQSFAGWSDEDRERLHALLRMFEQLHDLVGRRLFRGALSLSGEDPAALSARNLVRRLETLGGIASADRWLDLSTTRNLLVHDYPVNARQQADRGNLAWNALANLLAATVRIIDFIRSEDLLA